MRLVAVLIVRDEEAVLGACLEALAGSVDAIHVHDTGSRDGTLAVARAAGAAVSSAPWPGDFAAARDAAVAACAAGAPFGDGDWVLAVDADELLRAEAPALRALLRGADRDAAAVQIDNDRDDGSYTHEAVRLYRPSVAHFTGAVHERVVRRDGAPLRTVPVPRPVALLEHSGYRTQRARQAKGARNAALASADVARLERTGGTERDLSRATLDLARSELAAAGPDAARPTFLSVTARWPASRAALEAREFLARLALAAGRDEEARALAEELRRAGGRPEYADWLAAQALVQLGDVAGAASCLARVTTLVDSGGRRHDEGALRDLRALFRELEDSLRGD